ncbi:MAG: glycosyltransferase [Nitrospira sp.]|nr:glycosyltransferase [Nitrospira sp.]
MSLERQVKLLGWKTHEEVKILLEDSHVLVAPSLTSAGGDEEGIPNAIKEAMASGLPVIGTFHSGIPELVTDGVSSLLVPERDPASLADALAYLMHHPEICDEMGRAGRRQVEQKFDTNSLKIRSWKSYTWDLCKKRNSWFQNLPIRTQYASICDLRYRFGFALMV